MGTTPTLAFPYPELADENNPPADLKALAVALETAVLALHQSVADVASLPVAGDYPGQRIFVTATSETAVWNGTEWTNIWLPFTPAWTGVTLGGAGLVKTGELIRIGRLIIIKTLLTLGSGGSFTATALLTLPKNAANSNFDAIGTAVYDDSSSGPSARRTGTAYRTNATTAQFSLGDNPAGSTNVSSSIPFTWDVGDTLAATLQYKTV